MSLFARYASAWHGGFDDVVQAPRPIASRFAVRNVSRQGQMVVKLNCNLFRLRQDRFDEMVVQMSGDNSLGRSGRSIGPKINGCRYRLGAALCGTVARRWAAAPRWR